MTKAVQTKAVQTKAVQTKEEQNLAAGSEADYGEFAGAGFENVGSDSVAVPRLVLLQKGSPEADDTQPEYIEGARAGTLLNRVTGATYDAKTGLEVILCYFERRYLVWAPRDTGGGLVSVWDETEYLTAKRNGMVDRDGAAEIDMEGNRISDTRIHYLIGLPDLEPAVMSLSSTAIKRSRLLIAQAMRPANSPAFSKVFRLTAVPEKNDKGTWYAPEFTFVRPVEVGSAEWKSAVETYKMARAMTTEDRAKTLAGADEPAEENDGAAF